MKTRDFSRFSAWIMVVATVLVVAACDDGKSPEEVEDDPSSPLEVTAVIFDPKVGVPNDTLLLTAVITSNSPNETDVPTVKWTASGGTFIEDDQQTVRWIAPGSSGIFTITARATNEANTATRNTDVFVGVGGTLIASETGQIDLVGTGPDFHYLRTGDVTRGTDVWLFSGGVASDAAPPSVANNLHVTYSPNGTMEAHAADTTFVGAAIRPRNIYVSTFGGSAHRITIDAQGLGAPEHNVCEQPSFSPNNQLVAYQRWAQSGAVGVTDSFHVYIHDLVAQKRTKVTHDWEFPRGFFPTFSTDSNWLVYVADTQRTNQWDLYASPMTGNDVDGSLASLERLTNTGGALVIGAPRTIRRPPMAWNPVSPVLAISAADNNLYLVTTHATGGDAVTVDGVNRAVELLWSPDGSVLAVSALLTIDTDTYSKLCTVTPAGTATNIFTAIPGDNLRDMRFSPDGNWLLFRTARGGGSWFSVLDVGGGTPGEPVPITATDPVGGATDYRAAMSLAPAWTSANLMIYPSFTGGPTPGIFTRDLSGLGN